MFCVQNYKGLWNMCRSFNVLLFTFLFFVLKFSSFIKNSSNFLCNHFEADCSHFSKKLVLSITDSSCDKFLRSISIEPNFSPNTLSGMCYVLCHMHNKCFILIIWIEYFLSINVTLSIINVSSESGPLDIMKSSASWSVRVAHPHHSNFTLRRKTENT